MGIIKQGKIYHFRLKIPSQFQYYFRNKTLKLTLKTTDVRKAQKKAKIIKSLTDTFFIKLQKGHSMNCQALNKFIREYVKDGLEQFDQDQAHGRRGNSGTVDKDLFGFDFLIPALKEELSTRMHVERMSRNILEYYPDCVFRTH